MSSQHRSARKAEAGGGRVVIRIHHHTLLERRGGAARVSELLRQRAAELDQRVTHSFEAAVTAAGQAQLDATPWPAALEEAMRQGAVVHAHSTASWEALLEFLQGRRVKAVVTLHDFQMISGGCVYPLECEGTVRGCPEPCPRGYERAGPARARRLELLRALDPALVSPSGWLKRQAAEAFAGSHETPPTVRLIPNGVPWPTTPPDGAAKARAKRSLGVDPEARVVLFSAHGGRKAAYKAGDRWDSLWRIIKTRAPETVGVFMGELESGREGDLLRLPYLEPDRVRAVMTAADVLCYPTLADNHPLTVLEAMAAGAAVVAFAVGGVPEQAQHGETAVLTPPGRWEELASATASLLAKPHRARSLARAAYERGASRFNDVRMARDYHTLYARLAQP